MSRSYFHSGYRHGLPPLGYPRIDVSAARAHIPDHRTVWAFTDIHGVLSGLRQALVEAGLIDADGHWIGGSNVALVGIGDYIDRGADSKGVIDFLRGLQREIIEADSRLVLVRGNHEQMLADILRGSDEWADSWAANGGHALARSYGLPGAKWPVRAFADRLNERAPELLPWLMDTLPYARWRDVVFVHAGLPSSGTLGMLSITDKQLWDPNAAFLSGVGVLLEPHLRGFHDHGVRRVVIGHHPQDRGPAIEHNGTLLMLDTNASGMRSPTGIQMTACVTLARISPESSFEQTEFVSIDTSDAPDRGPR